MSLNAAILSPENALRRCSGTLRWQIFFLGLKIIENSRKTALYGSFPWHFNSLPLLPAWLTKVFYLWDFGRLLAKLVKSPETSAFFMEVFAWKKWKAKIFSVESKSVFSDESFQLLKMLQAIRVRFVFQAYTCHGFVRWKAMFRFLFWWILSRWWELPSRFWNDFLEYFLL